jgi:hypothetical protein
MEAKANDEVIAIEPEGNFRKCPVCRYNDGFHVSFQMEDGSKQGKIILICPNCHQQFQMGWKVRIE